MVGLWTPEQLLVAHPESGRTSLVEFAGSQARAVDASDDFRRVAELDGRGILSVYEAGASPVWQREVGEVADRVYVSPQGGTILLKDKDGRFRYYSPDGHLQRKFRFGGEMESEVSGLAEDFTVFLRGGHRVSVLEHDGNEVFSGSLFKHTVGVEILGRQLAVYGPNGATALLDPWEDKVHEMFPPPGKVRLRCEPGQDPVLIHVAGKAITAFSGYKRKLDVDWRFDCHAPIEMADADLNGRRIAALAADRLYWVGPPDADNQ